MISHLLQMNFLDFCLSPGTDVYNHFPQVGHLHSFIRKTSQENSKTVLIRNEKAKVWLNSIEPFC